MAEKAGGLELQLSAGRSLSSRPVSADCDEVTIRSGSGEILMEVLLTPAGPVLRFKAAQVQVECEGAFQVRCESFDVQTTGDIRQQAGGVLRAESREISIEATRGDVSVKANDDVNLNGERVRLNCD